MVDRELLMEKTKLLNEYINDLEEKKNITLDDLKNDKVLRRYIERTLHLAVEACLDTGNHLVADLALREPEDYKDIMTVLAEAGHLPKNKLARFKKMAQFRNVIVHDYARLDPEILLGILQKNLADLRLFAAMIRDKFL
ncbi:type VII toxin-antitoxin system HepT family RNase toxin [Desulfotomaculum copahuensis]|uniref:DUF86 domain-containing protein n=1 Tax=Desulfotomaculum copahuensis TaxID=1838280 RepID=A0A1B7LC98_9FIRM|nr:DUF86 domain-containing protein [Desulfotomaculum copahuensis]OAT80354.1 hypothetical protein A6M21_13775 [Desulfotomaculum copahuensis]